MNAVERSAARAFGAGVGRAAGWLATRLNPVGDASGALETGSFLDSFTTSLMPRTSELQGLATGIHVLSARLVGTRVDALQTLLLGAGAGLPASLAGRAVTAGVGQAAVSALPEQDGETLWRSGVRVGGQLVRAAAVSGAIYDATRVARRSGRSNTPPWVPPVLVGGGTLLWAGQRLRHRRKVIPRWPVEQRADLPKSVAVAGAVSLAGSAVAKGFLLTRAGLIDYFGPGGARPLVARATNVGLWGTAGVIGYNAAIASVGRTNEKVERSYSTTPPSPLLSGSSESLSNFAEIGLQGRRYVTDVVTPGMIEDVMGEPAAAHPIRTYVGFNSIPLYQAGRAEMALEEMERSGAFDRKYLMLISPAGTGWLDQTVVEAAEFLARGDIASCAIQYGRYPSFLSLQKVGLGRGQFRLLLWGVRQRLRAMPPDQRPTVFVFGESLGAWTASDVMMAQGIGGFEHYGVDRALWIGLPALAKWSRNGMATGSSDLVPEGTVGVFDRPEQLAALTDEERERLRAVILSHDNDPLAALRPELMIQQPDWLRGDERGRNVPDDMTWTPVNTFWQVLVDAANAIKGIPGEFGSFGHDYRADLARFVRDTFHLPATEAQTERLEEALVALELERRDRLRIRWDDDTPVPQSTRFPEERFAGGIPLDTNRTRGARWRG